MGLLSDLFPGVDPPRKRDYDFEEVSVHGSVRQADSLLVANNLTVRLNVTLALAHQLMAVLVDVTLW